MKTLVLMAAVALAPAAAFAQWSDNFDSYTPGSINGQGPGPGASANGPWQGWDGVAGVAGTVSTAFARSAPNSQLIQGTTDSVQRYGGVFSGSWVYTAWQYIPAGFTGNTYLILNAAYNDLGPYNWAVQMLFSGTTGLVTDDNARVGENVISFVTNQWAEIRIEFDLDTNTMNQFYNGQLLLTSTYTAPPPFVPGPLSLEAVDLYTTTTSPVYYDDMSLVAAGPACDPDFNCDGNPDQDDVACIINVVAGNPGCECQDPDFNQDGNVDQDDLAALINVVAGGLCP